MLGPLNAKRALKAKKSSALFLTSALYGVGWPTLRPGPIISGKNRPGTQYTGGCVGPKGSLDRCRKFTLPTGTRSPDRPARSKSLYGLCCCGPPCDQITHWKC